jgi:predicted DNA-binding protein
MRSNLQPKKVRLNIQISSELKSKLSQLSAFQGKKVSTLVRESIEEKLEQIDKKIFEEKMKHAYQELAQENLKISSYPICVAIKKGNGLKKDSVVNLSQIRTIDKKRLITPKLATLSNDSMKKVDDALKNSLALS